MIALITDALPSCVTGFEPVSGRFLAWWEAYKNTTFARFYQTENSGGIAVLDAQAVVCAPESDREEIAAFLELQQDIRTVYTNLPCILQGKTTTFTAMKADFHAEPSTEEEAKLQDLYAFLHPFFPDLPPFEAWYLDVAYRTRHGLCRHAVITGDNEIVSAAMSVAEWQGGALLGGVATADAYRRRGYAARCVSALVFALQQMNKQVYICPYTPQAKQLYYSLGFRECATVTVIERT